MKTKSLKGETNPARRNMHSFEADEDVERMLQRVDSKGIRFVWYANRVLRKQLIADGYGRKKDEQ